MSRNAGATPSGPRKGPRWSHLRQSSVTSYDRTSAGSPGSPRSTSTHSTIKEDRRRRAERYCQVAVNDGYARDEVLLNLDLLGGDVKPGSLMSITPLKGDAARSASGAYGSVSKQPQEHCDSSKAASGGHADHDCQHNRYIFVAKDMPKEMKARQPDVEVYVVKHIADAFGMKKGSQVLLAPVRSGLASVSPSPC